MERHVKNYSVHDFLADYEVLSDGKRVLNAGSSTVRYGENCVNIDIQDHENVDVLCDIHELPESLGEFDVIICNAVLQYCRSPETVAKEFYRVLKPGGLLFIDAPWVQPACPDTPDRFRFSEDALRQIFTDYQILTCGPSIRSGSAFSLYGLHIARTMTRNKYVNFGLAKLAVIVLYPFRWISTVDENKTAGALYLICQKPS